MLVRMRQRGSPSYKYFVDRRRIRKAWRFHPVMDSVYDSSTKLKPPRGRALGNAYERLYIRHSGTRDEDSVCFLKRVLIPNVIATWRRFLCASLYVLLPSRHYSVGISIDTLFLRFQLQCSFSVLQSMQV